MLEIGEGEVILRSGKLDVTLLADVEQLAAVDVRAAPGWGKAPPHVHARHGEALYVLDGELALDSRTRRVGLGPESWAFVPPRSCTPSRWRATHRRDSSSSTRRARATATTCAATSRVSTSGRRRTPSRPIPGSSSSRRAGGADGDTITNRPGRRATVLVEADELTISGVRLRPRRARGAAACPPRARGRVPRRRRRLHVPPARRLATPCRPGRSSSSRPASCTASTTTATSRRAVSTSTCRRSGSPTTCAAGTPASTSSSRPRTAASTQRPSWSRGSRSNVPA